MLTPTGTDHFNGEAADAQSKGRTVATLVPGWLLSATKDVPLMKTIALVAAFFLVGINTDGQQWTALTPAHAPSPRWNHAMAFDTGHNCGILFGGASGPSGASASYSSETWKWTGIDWILLHPTTSPSARAGHAMAYDSKRGRIVLFGGEPVGNGSSETWEWDGSQWAIATPLTIPEGRYEHAMAYDEAIGKVVLYGGRSTTTGNQLSDTWEWDGANWTQQSPLHSPGPLHAQAMAYDAARATVSMFSGYKAATSSVVDELWEWNAGDWTLATPSTTPVARHNAALSYDPHDQRMIMFGGTYATAYFPGTWAWKGNTWTQLSPATEPPLRQAHTMIYDATSNRILLFGGFRINKPNFGDTWAFSLSNTTNTGFLDGFASPFNPPGPCSPVPWPPQYSTASANWNYVCWQWPSAHCSSCYLTPQQVSVGGGVLSLSAGPQPGGEFHAAQIETRVKRNFGRYRASIRSAPANLLWGFSEGAISAFFTYEEGDGEIDVEILTLDTNAAFSQIRFTVHDFMNGISVEKNVQISNFDPSAQFAVYGFDWHPDNIDFFIGKHRVASVDSTEIRIPQRPARLILNCWSSNDLGFGGLLPSSSTTMMVDWVRHSKLFPSASTLPGPTGWVKK